VIAKLTFPFFRVWSIDQRGQVWRKRIDKFKVNQEIFAHRPHTYVSGCLRRSDTMQLSREALQEVVLSAGSTAAVAEAPEAEAEQGGWSVGA
jgi:hypothetical protein